MSYVVCNYFCGLPAKFCLLGYISSTVSAIKLQVKEHILTVPLLLFYILQKYYPNKTGVFSQGLLPYGGTR
jgi:hypothetical protein